MMMTMMMMMMMMMMTGHLVSHLKTHGGKGKKKNALELSKKMRLQLDFGRGERLGVRQSRREVVPEHWSSRLEGARTIAVSCRYRHDSQG